MARKKKKSKQKEGKVYNLPGGVKRTMLDDGGHIDFIPDDPKAKSSIKGRYEVTRGYKETSEERLERIQGAQRANRYDPGNKKKTRRSSKNEAINNSLKDS